MMSGKEKEPVDQEKLDLEDLMTHKIFRDFIRSQVLEPCHVFTKCSSNDPIYNARFLSAQGIGMDILANIKQANLEAYFELEREIQFDEGNENDG